MPEAAVTPPEPPENENLIVKLDDEPGLPLSNEGAETAAPKAPAPEPEAPPPSAAALEELQRQVESDRARRDSLTAENRRLQEERDRALAMAHEAERRGISTQEVFVENQLKMAEDQLASLTEQQATAGENGDWKVFAALGRKISDLSGNAAMMRRDRDILAQRRVQPQQPARETEPAPSTDPVEVATRGRSDKTAAFLRKHPELIRDNGTLKRIAVDLHESALDEGFSVDTEGYFQHIEKVLADAAARKTPAPVAANGGGGTPRHGAPTVAAPVSRSSAPGGASGGTFVMTPAMRRLASEQGVTPREWVEGFLKAKAEGKIPQDWMPK